MGVYWILSIVGAAISFGFLWEKKWALYSLSLLVGAYLIQAAAGSHFDQDQSLWSEKVTVLGWEVGDRGRGAYTSNYAITWVVVGVIVPFVMPWIRRIVDHTGRTIEVAQEKAQIAQAERQQKKLQLQHHQQFQQQVQLIELEKSQSAEQRARQRLQNGVASLRNHVRLIRPGADLVRIINTIDEELHKIENDDEITDVMLRQAAVQSDVEWMINEIINRNADDGSVVSLMRRTFKKNII
jgi:hypothetical protein